MSAVRTLFVASRPISWVNTAFPFGAAYLLTVRELDVTFVVGVVFFLIPYNLAMYGINDVFDYASDINNPRKGGAQGAVLDQSLHRTTLWASVLSCLPFLVYLVAVGDAASWIVLAVSMFFVVFYSAPPLRLKEVPFVDSMTSSIHFFSPAVYGLVLAQATWTPGLWAIVVAFALWGIASHAFGAVQDVVADRDAGIASVATVMGAAFTVRFALAGYVLAGLVMLATSWPGPLAGLLALPYVLTVWPYRRLPDAEAARATKGWTRFIAINLFCGFLVTLLLIWWWALTA